MPQILAASIVLRFFSLFSRDANVTALLKGVQLTLVPALDKANFEKHHPGEGRGGALCEGEGSPSLVRGGGALYCYK